ncbi:MAG: hypothetical protein ACR2QO_11710 [Acidimicrobiales bacterium]
MAEGIASIKEGRYVRRGLTWKSAVLALIVITVIATGLGALAGLFQPEYPVTIEVVETRVVGTEPTCSWEVDLEIRNDGTRRLRLLSVAITNVDDSLHGIIGSFDTGETIARTYRYDVPDCAAPEAEQLVLRYGPAMTTKERSLTVNLDGSVAD